MARMKPQMTPEQQTAYRQAVAQNVIDSIPYEKYCAITLVLFLNKLYYSPAVLEKI